MTCRNNFVEYEMLFLKFWAYLVKYEMDLLQTMTCLPEGNHMTNQKCLSELYF